MATRVGQRVFERRKQKTESTWLSFSFSRRDKEQKRWGRGRGSGRGKTAGRGHKGAKARQGIEGYGKGFEGGQFLFTGDFLNLDLQTKNLKRSPLM